MESQDTRGQRNDPPTDAMKTRLAAVVLCMLFGTTTMANDWWVPSPLSVAITVGQWLMKDREEVFYIRVRAQGRDEQDAREQAFRLAVNQAIGTLVITETELSGNRITRDDIIAHSSGMVHDFDIVSSQWRGNRQEIEIDIWVARSQIADRVLSKSRDAGRVEGGRIAQQIESWHTTRLTGDSVIETVLNDFPARSFDVSVENTQVTVDDQRRTNLVIPVTVSWNTVYLNSLREAAERISHQPDCNGWFMRSSPLCRSKTKILIGAAGGYFDDQKVGEIGMREMWNDPPRLLLTLKNTQNHMVYRDCWIINRVHPGDWGQPFYDISTRWGVQIHERSRERVLVALDLAHLPTRDLDRVEAEMVRQSQCPRK